MILSAQQHRLKFFFLSVEGFIVVAACVMTFEARDSAAKVVPARFKMGSTSGTMGVVVGGGGGSGRTRNSSGIRRGATGRFESQQLPN